VQVLERKEAEPAAVDEMVEKKREELLEANATSGSARGSRRAATRS
jgi:hypothetical protein